ncbi:MAG TPA: glycosyltransferase family 39 protein [Acidobacteriaceae bacterium]
MPPAAQSSELNPPSVKLRPLPQWMLFPPIFVFVYLTHITLLRLPYFWDESGYYIPAAFDFFRTGTLIPYSTLSNAHPPLPSVLLAAWWHLSGFVPSGTRTAICLVTAFALLAVYRIARSFCGELGAATVTLLTALYPIWFAQSTLAHADIFAAAFTLWGIALYLVYIEQPAPPPLSLVALALFFCLSVLSKETALGMPLLLALLEILRATRARPRLGLRWGTIAALLSPLLPLAAWYAYHRHVTGFTFGNPEYLRYNATANLSAQRIAFALFHRAVHLTAHMELFVPVLCALACLFLPVLPHARPALPRRVVLTLAVLLAGNWIFFSVFGGALLTRYLLPAYPLILLLCVATWMRHIRSWWPFAAFSAAAFIFGIHVNPPYHFAPEDNLAYRDMIVLQQQASSFIVQRWPQATVLTAWPMSDELRKPELGYVRKPIQVVAIDNFSLPQLQQAANGDTFDTALIFSTKYDPPSLRGRKETMATRYFDFHRDLFPAQAAAVLHGSIVWQAQRNGQWAAVVRLDRGSVAQLR